MYEYEYVNIRTGGGFIFNNAEAQHRDIIASEAEEGWRFVGFVPTEFSGYGGIKALDLVFEREIKE